MFLSRLILNPMSARVQKELANIYELHRTIMRAFPDELSDAQERVLFRVDVERRSGVPTVLVQSLGEPDWSFLQEKQMQDYLLETEIENPAYKPFEPRPARGQLLRFRLRANPTFRRGGKRLAWLREEEQVGWLRRKAEQGGFGLVSVVVVPEGFQDSRKGAREGQWRVRHYAVRFDGILQVTAPDDFVETLRRGIGPGKAFGFGLLSIAPA